MAKLKRIANAVVLVVVVFGVIVAGVSCKSKASKTQPPPAENLFAVQVNNFQYTLSQIDQFLTGVSPIPMGLQMIVRAQLGGLLGSPELPGVNMNGSVGVFGVLMPGEADATSRFFAGALMPVTDYDKLIEDNPNCGEPDDNDVSRITVGGGGMLGPGVQGVESISKVGPELLVAELGGYALITWGSQYDNLVEYTKLMSSADESASVPELACVSDSGLSEQAAKEPIWIYGDIQAVSKAFGPMLFERIDGLSDLMGNMDARMQETMKKLQETRDKMVADGGDQAMIEQMDAQIQMLKDQQNRPMPFQSPEGLEKIMDMYVGILKAVLNGTESLTVTIKPDPKVLHITETVSAVPGTDMADLFTAGASAEVENNLLGYLDDEAAMNFAFKTNSPFWKKLTVMSMDFITALAGPDTSAEDIAKFKSFAAEAIDSLSGPVVMSVSMEPESKPPFAGKYVLAVKDADKFHSVIEQSVEMLKTSGIMDFYKTLGMEFDFTVRRAVDTYKEVSIDSAKLELKSTEPNDPNNPMGQMMSAMYGDGFEYRWGILDGLCVMAIGSEADSTVHALIDQVKAGGPTELGAEMKEALGFLPELKKADFFATYNYVRLFKMIGPMMQAMPMGLGAGTMPEIDIPSKSNLYIAGKIGDDKLVVDIALPKQHLSELVTAFMMFQQQIQAQMNVSSTKAKLGSLGPAVEKFRVDTGRYPTEDEGLMALVKKPGDVENWEGPYLSTPYLPKDAWNNDFIYEQDSAGGFIITSYGADRKEGGEGLDADLLSND